jgi:hypothetical protein
MSRSALPSPLVDRTVLRRVAAALRLLASDRDGEVVAAARAVRRTLAGVGADLNDLASYVENAAANDPGTMPLGPSAMAAELLHQHRADLTLWELSFLEALVDRPRLSPKQADKIAEIYSQRAS